MVLNVLPHLRISTQRNQSARVSAFSALTLTRALALDRYSGVYHAKEIPRFLKEKACQGTCSVNKFI